MIAFLAFGFLGFFGKANIAHAPASVAKELWAGWFLRDEPAIPLPFSLQGAGLSLDTSTTTTHTIFYTATDSAGNTASTTRTVNVISAP